ncbi:MAG TPA: hypothetical protein VGE01_05955 [Fimbriimonas sp.]
MKLLLPLALLALASGKTTVTSRAGFAIPHEGPSGSASIVVDIVHTESGATGTLTYAAEDHLEGDHAGAARGPSAAFPHLLVRVRRFSEVAVDGGRVEVKGYGRLHDASVRVQAVLVDNAGTGKADTFAITCKDPNGHVVYERSASIETGDIAVRRDP